MQLSNKRAAVIGLARAGVPAARFLLERGAQVVGYDSKTREQLSDEVLELEREGVELNLGEHDFENIESCDLVVLSPGLKVHFEPLKSVIERVEHAGGEVIGELELASRFCPCPMIAVTGTKGKSTTVKLITEMLLACGVKAVSAGNTGTPLISVLPQLSSNSWAVVEVSSFQLEKAPTFKPKIAVLLSLLEDHQDYHPTLEQYFETKLKIFANQDEWDDTAIFNVDDARVNDMMRSRKWPASQVFGIATNHPEWAFYDGYFQDLEGHKISFEDELDARRREYARNLKKHGLNNSDLADRVAKQAVRPSDTYHPTLKWEDGELFALGDFVINADEIPLRGKHNQANLTVAMQAVVCAAGLEETWVHWPKHALPGVVQIADAIRNFQPLPHRLEIVARKDGVTYVNDSQSTIPDAAIAALKAFPAPVSLLLGGRAKIGSESYVGLMKTVKEVKAKIFLFGEAKEMLEEVAGRENVEKLCIYRENTLADALQLAKMNASSGETVVLSPACASFDQFSSYEERGETFKRLAREP